MKKNEEVAVVMENLKATGLITAGNELEFQKAVKNGLKEIRMRKYSEKTKSHLRRIHK